MPPPPAVDHRDTIEHVLQTSLHTPKVSISNLLRRTSLLSESGFRGKEAKTGDAKAAL